MLSLVRIVSSCPRDCHVDVSGCCVRDLRHDSSLRLLHCCSQLVLVLDTITFWTSPNASLIAAGHRLECPCSIDRETSMLLRLNTSIVYHSWVWGLYRSIPTRYHTRYYVPGIRFSTCCPCSSQVHVDGRCIVLYVRTYTRRQHQISSLVLIIIIPTHTNNSRFVLLQDPPARSCTRLSLLAEAGVFAEAERLAVASNVA